MPRLPLLVFACAPLVGLLACLAQVAPSPTAPITRRFPATLPGKMLHLPDMPLHDPFIVAHEPTKTYYLYTSHVRPMTGIDARGTMVYRSKDLRNWENPTLVFTVPGDSWADPQQGPWAPEVHEYQGKFYLFTTLHNSQKVLAEPPAVPRGTHMRSTVIATSDTPDGPFELIKKESPVAPADFMVLDGTLFLDETDRPWMVYAHEWIQKTDGTMEAIPLTPDLSDADAEPIHLFKASDAPWLNAEIRPTTQPLQYVTDGPQFHRTRTGVLLMLWSSYDKDGYVQTLARSRSGKLQGPWEQLPPLLHRDSGHGMLFRTFEGQLMLVVHRPFKNARGKLYEVSDEGDTISIVRQRTDLDGDE